jgi:glutamyl-Q tRNA(Asp) synthetase
MPLETLQAATGRFAPSPTGDLHFGSLLAAVASFAQARASGGHWLVRIEDSDPPRVVPGSAERILADLGRFNMRSDQPVLYQGERTAVYRSAVQQLLDQGLAYWCGCSRADLPESGVYPGTCRHGLPSGKRRRSVRLTAPRQPVRFTDLVQGEITEDIQETVGDFVIWRADRLPAYQLAVVVDDAFQGATEVVRGADLLESTARQIHLQRSLGLATPSYAHHPVALGEDGRKLSKRFGSDPVATGAPARTLQMALRFLGQPCPDGPNLEATWRWALDNWRLARVPRCHGIPWPSGPAPTRGDCFGL